MSILAKPLQNSKRSQSELTPQVSPKKFHSPKLDFFYRSQYNHNHNERNYSPN